jgi:hypothetical protein
MLVTEKNNVVQMQHSLTDEHPNLFKQWTEQTELTAHIVKQQKVLHSPQQNKKTLD